MKNFYPNRPLRAFFTSIAIMGMFAMNGCDSTGDEDPIPDPEEVVDPNAFIPLHRMDILDNGTNGKHFEVKFYPMDAEKHKPKTYLSTSEGPFEIIIKNRNLEDFGERYIGTYTDAFDFEKNKFDSILVINITTGEQVAGFTGTGGTKNNMPNGINITKTPEALQKALGLRYSIN
jgi:hypothetical protein